MLSLLVRRVLSQVPAVLIILLALYPGVFQLSASTAHAMFESNDQSIPRPTSASLRYLALGDSYSIGESVSPTERFPVQLTHALRVQGLDVADPEIIARTGWTTDELDRALNADTPQGSFDLVTLLIGVNNQYRVRTPENYRPEFVNLLQRAIHFADNQPGRVIVISIPDWGASPFGQNRKNVGPEIDAFNAINRAETLQLGAHYIDITPISREALHDPALIASDGLHPSGKMYALWVELLTPTAQQVLNSD